MFGRTWGSTNRIPNANLQPRTIPEKDITKELVEWNTFYLIVGTGAAALTGLQFVVLTLIAERPPVRAAEASAAFATPTIVHFGAVLFLSALLNAPWQAITPSALLWGFVGFSGVIYIVIVARRIRVQTTYKPEFHDWLFHVLLPLGAYAMLVVSAFAASSHTREALFSVGVAALFLLFVGIHNAWDAVTYHVFVGKQRKGGNECSG
jgi:hypothetical protein